MLSTFQRVLEQIELNRAKEDNCLPFDRQFPRLSEYVKGIQRKRYYLIAGASGSGKSHFADEVFVFNPIDYILSKKNDLKLKILYYSFELDKETKMLQWMVKRLYKVYGIRVDTDIVNSVGKNRLNDDLLMAIRETQSYFDRISEFISIQDTIKTPEQILSEVHKYAAENGTIVSKPDGTFDHYKPNHPDEYVIIIVDHYSLLRVANGSNIKAAIEKLSQGFVEIRNRYGYIPAPIQQLSAEKENVEHFKLSKLEPAKDGLAESKLTYNDCDMALGLFNPYKHEIKTYRGYNIDLLGDHYRNLNVFKNRFGVPHLNTGVYFDGSNGFFKELPSAKEMGSFHYEAVKKRKPNW